MPPRLLLILALAAAPAGAADVDIVQTGWDAGAVSGSTTAATTGWRAYESQDGNAVALSTALKSLTGISRSWAVTDDGSGTGGFAAPGALFSSAAVSGTGSGAFVRLALDEAARTLGVTLLQGRERMAAVYHPGTRKIYVFGGHRADGPLTNDVLEYDALTGTLQGAPDLLPTARAGVSAAYDPASNKIFVFGGYDSGGLELGQVVKYDPVGHSVQDAGTLPTARSLTSAAYDPATQRIYVFGGRQFGAGINLADIVAYNTGTETSVAVATTLPSGRVDTAAVYDAASGDILVFGGNSTGTYLDDVVAFHPSGSSSTLLAPLPAPRAGAAVLRNASTGKVYLYGGENGGVPTAEILEFDPASRTAQPRPTALPSARARAAAAADPVNLRYVIFGGTTAATALDEVVAHSQVSSGVYRSAVFDTGNLSQLGTASWNPAVQADSSTALGLSFRSGNTPAPGPTWSGSGAFTGVSNGGSLASLGSSRYVQFAATFTTTNISTTAILSDIAVTFAQTAPSATLTSSAFDTGFSGTIIRKLRWGGVFQPGTTSQFRLRTAPDDGSGHPGAWTAWLGPASTTDYYTDPNGGQVVHSSHSDGVGDRFVQYQAVLLTSATLVPAVLTTVTLSVNHVPGAPTLDSLVALSSADISASFTDGSDNETDFVLSTGTLPGPTNLGVSTPTAASAATGGSQSVTARGLLPNTAYFVRVRARNASDGILSGYSGELNVFTLANTPTGVTVSSVSLTSATLSWNASGNPGNTSYEVTASTDGFVTDFSTPVAFAAGLTAPTTALVSLTPGTTWSFRVRALNGNAVATPYSAVVATATVPSALAGLSTAAAGVSSVTFSWSSSGPSARYRVVSASTGTLLSDTAALSFTYAGASTNSPVGVRIQPYTGTAAAALSAPATAYTRAADPAAFAAVSLGTGAIRLSWSANGNPFGTRYELESSTVSFSASVSTPIPLSASFVSLTTTYVGLPAGTTHFWRLRAYNADGLPTAQSSDSTQTLPGSVSAPAGAALGVSSIAWSWTNTAGPAVTAFVLSRASDGVVIATVSAQSFDETGLSSDTAYGLRVRALGGAGAGALSLGTTVYTRAAPPAQTLVFAVYDDSATLVWSASGNPARTVYEVERATPGGPFVQFSAATGTAATALNLSPDTTFQFRVRAVNGDLVATAYDAAVSTYVQGVLPLPPRAFRAFPAGSARLLLSWAVSPTTTVVRYALFHDSGTGAVDYSLAFATVPASATTYLTAPLVPNATYLLGIRAVNERGADDKNTDVLASAVAAATAPALSAFLRSPAGGTRVWGDRLTLTAAFSAGLASQASRVLFQFRASTSGAWTDAAAAEAAHANPATAQPFVTFWDVTGLAAGRYQLRAVARAADGTDDPSPPVASLVVDPVNPDREEVRLAAGRVRTRLKVFREAPAELDAASPDGAFTTRLVLSSGCVAAAQDVLRLDGAPTGVPAVPSSFSAAGIFRAVTLESGQTALSAPRCAALAFSRLDTDMNRRVDGTETRSDNLVLGYYDAALGRWAVDSLSAVAGDDGGTLTSLTSHFTLFGVFSPAASGVDTVRVYPVPWRPGNADPDDGKPWSAGDPTSGIIFDNLPADARLSVYTVAGSLVWESPGPAQGGLRRWDARTGDGRDVASGVYFLVVTAPDGAARVEKLVVIR